MPRPSQNGRRPTETDGGLQHRDRRPPPPSSWPPIQLATHRRHEQLGESVEAVSPPCTQVRVVTDARQSAELLKGHRRARDQLQQQQFFGVFSMRSTRQINRQRGAHRRDRIAHRLTSCKTAHELSLPHAVDPARVRGRGPSPPAEREWAGSLRIHEDPPRVSGCTRQPQGPRRLHRHTRGVLNLTGISIPSHPPATHASGPRHVYPTSAGTSRPCGRDPSDSRILEDCRLKECPRRRLTQDPRKGSRLPGSLVPAYPVLLPRAAGRGLPLNLTQGPRPVRRRMRVVPSSQRSSVWSSSIRAPGPA